MLDFLKKHKERATLIGVGFAFLLFVGGGIYLQDKNMQENEPVTVASPKTVSGFRRTACSMICATMPQAASVLSRMMTSISISSQIRRMHAAVV